MFFKTSVLNNFAILEPLSNNKVADLLLQKTYGNCFLLYLLLTVAPVFALDSFWKHELNLRSSHWCYSVKRVFLEHLQISQENDCCWSLFLIELQTCHRCFLVNFRNFSEHLIWSLRRTASETCSFTWTSLFNNLRFCLSIFPSLLLILLQSERQLSRGALRKMYINKFCKFHKKTPALKIRF